MAVFRSSARVEDIVLRVSLDAVISIDARGVVLEFNPAAERMFGYLRAQVLGRDLAELIIGARQRDGRRRDLLRMLEGGAERILDRCVEFEAQRADGALFPVELAVSRMGGATAAYVGFVRDLSDHERVGRERAEPLGASALPDLPAALSTLVDGLAADRGAVLPPSGMALSLGQVARALGISTTTARRWADEGLLDTTRTSGGHRRFATSEVRRVLAARGPAISATAPPRRPLAALAELVESHGLALADLSWRGLYGDLRSGFFADPEAAVAAERWIGVLCAAATSADYELLHDATSALMRAAEGRGASLLERHLALERFAETAARALTRGWAPRDEIVETRRLFAFLGQRQLANAG
jgi:PAS domain S-box-containing protein/excisionase family DNA binding protein